VALITPGALLVTARLRHDTSSGTTALRQPAHRHSAFRRTDPPVKGTPSCLWSDLRSRHASCWC
jgi:hypothetical protein